VLTIEILEFEKAPSDLIISHDCSHLWQSVFKADAIQIFVKFPLKVLSKLFSLLVFAFFSNRS